MKRRNFLIGVGGTAIGGSALVGSGAFSRVESNRSVEIKVANDNDAYLGFDECPGSLNSQNYSGLDDNGHGYLKFADQGGHGEGINSNSVTWFDNTFRVTNQGKATMDFYVEDSDDLGEGEGEVLFYTGGASGSQGDEGITSIVGKDNSISLGTGETECIGVRVNSAKEGQEDIDLMVTAVADSPEAGGE